MLFYKILFFCHFVSLCVRGPLHAAMHHTHVIEHIYLCYGDWKLHFYVPVKPFFSIFLYIVFCPYNSLLFRSIFMFTVFQTVLGNFKLATLYTVQQHCKRTINSIYIVYIYVRTSPAALLSDWSKPEVPNKKAPPCETVKKCRDFLFYEYPKPVFF